MVTGTRGTLGQPGEGGVAELVLQWGKRPRGHGGKAQLAGGVPGM